MSIRGQCTELALPLLTGAATEAYLAARFPGSEFPEELAHLLQQRTAGNPLFIRNVVDSWAAQGAVIQVNGHWELQTRPETLAVGVPEQLRPFIEQQLRGLPAEDQQVLEAASVAGMAFSSAAVAAAIGRAEEEIERRCATLAQRDHFLRSNRITEWPDGTVAACFGFIHHFYQEVLYDRVSVGRQVRLHRQIGERLEAGYGAHAPERAAELAMHFVRGRKPERAVEYLRLAAEHALQRSAPREAIEHLTQGLEFLGQHPELPDRFRYELTLQAELGPALIATRGWSVPEAEKAYGRARELAHGLGDGRQLSQIL
jgi:predicted ATPase